MQKIAVLGGGIGSLSAVFEITNDPNWKQNYDITVYQMGWRLGGKGTSGRNRSMHDRIEEHGIHHAEDGGSCAQSQRQRRQRHQREAGRLPKQAHAVAQVHGLSG